MKPVGVLQVGKDAKAETPGNYLFSRAKRMSAVSLEHAETPSKTRSVGVRDTRFQGSGFSFREHGNCRASATPRLSRYTGRRMTTTEPTKPKPRRRWLQYSLRTFFVLLTVACVGLAWVGRQAFRAWEQRKAVEWVQEIGGTVSYDYQLDEDGIEIADAEPHGSEWLVELLGVDYFQEVSAVDLYDTQVSDLNALARLTSLKQLSLIDTHIDVSDLTPLAGLNNLKSLELSGTQVNDLTPLAGWNNLEGLSLDYTQVSDVTSLAGLKNLKWLSLRNTQVSDVTPLAGLKNLEWLLLDSTQVSDVTPLRGMKNLKALKLADTQVSDLTPLAKLTSLEWLFLDSTPVTDLTPLAKLTSLDFLSLVDTPVSDVTPLAELTSLKTLWLYNNTQFNNLTPLAKLTSLERLILDGTILSEEQVAKLRKALPNCTITCLPSDPPP